MINPFTQQQIADITGQTSVNVNRVFADLERQGLIRRDGPRDHASTTGPKCAASRASSRAIWNSVIARSLSRHQSTPPSRGTCGWPDARRLSPGQASRAWWARQGLNLRPHPCEGCALPLSYAPMPADEAPLSERADCLSRRSRPSERLTY